jgi:hypothetical protein
MPLLLRPIGWRARAASKSGRQPLHGVTPEVPPLRITRRTGKHTAYVQVLLGLLQAGESAFAVQPGAGMDVWITRAVGIRLGADYQHLISSGEPFHGVHVACVVSLAVVGPKSVPHHHCVWL